MKLSFSSWSDPSYRAPNHRGFKIHCVSSFLYSISLPSFFFTLNVTAPSFFSPDNVMLRFSKINLMLIYPTHISLIFPSTSQLFWFSCNFSDVPKVNLILLKWSHSLIHIFVLRYCVETAFTSHEHLSPCLQLELVTSAYHLFLPIICFQHTRPYVQPT